MVSVTKPVSIAERLANARQHIQQARLTEAETLCLQMVDEDPGLAAGWDLLAQIALAAGKPEDALELAGKAVAIQPNDADFLNTLGLANHQLGRLEQAKALLRHALTQRQDFPVAMNNLGNVYNALNRTEDAVLQYQQALALHPDYLEARFNLGLVLQRQGLWEQSIAAFRRVLAAYPQHVQALFRLAGVLLQTGRLDEAGRLYRQVIGLEPGAVEARFNLAHVLGRQGQRDQAIVELRQLLAIRPDLPEAHNSLGTLHEALHHLDEAQACYQKALEYRPDYADALNNLGNIFNRQGKLDDAEVQYQRALEARPDFPEAINGLAYVLKEQGRPHEAVAFYQRALDLQPDYYDAYSNLLLTLHYDARASAQVTETAHRDWGRLVAERFPLQAKGWDNERNPERRLRVGFVSADFYMHAVAFFFKDVLDNLKADELEVYLYANNVRRDAMTVRLQRAASAWRDISNLDDEAAAGLVRKDRIDILVDLSGHTAQSRLLVFARKPAPIQVTWLGYPDTTGLASMDYRLTDAIADPPGIPDWHSEELVRLPEGFLCFGEPVASPPLVSPPCVDSGIITFGSFNNNSKISPEIIRLWAEILERLPGSRLLVKNNSMGAASTRAVWKDAFRDHGVDEDRLELVPRVESYADHLALYGRIDVTLDVFPYNGTTTTCEALWMGVPVVTVRGDRHVSRVGASLLHRVGLDELVADDLDAYVSKAVSLASDTEKLVMLRQELRGRMQGSALGDGARFARTLEQAFRKMWLRWLAESFAAGSEAPCSSAQSESIKPKWTLNNSQDLQANFGALDLLLSQHGNAELKQRGAACGDALTKGVAGADVYAQLGQLAIQMQQAGLAERFFEHGLRANPASAALYFQHAGLLQRLGRDDEAIVRYKQALEYQPDLTDAYLNVATILREQQRIGELISWMRAALEKCAHVEGTGAAALRVTLGEALKFDGDMAAAIALFREALVFAPDNAYIYQTLAHTRKFTVLDEDIRQMEVFFQDPQRSREDKSRFGFSLGKAYEELAEYEKSFGYYQQANTLHRSAIQYATRDTAAQFDALKAQFTPALFARFQGYGSDSNQPVFIVGMPRSGSTLVEKILAAHPEVYGAGELTVFPHSVALIWADKAFSGKTFPAGLDRLQPALANRAADHYLKAIKDLVPEGGHRTADKLPHNFINIGMIRLILPSAKVVHIHRHPLDTCLSLFKHLFSGSHPYCYDLVELGQYYRMYQELMSHWHAVLPGFVHDVEYEALVSNPQQEIEKLLNFCALPWHDNCLAHDKSGNRSVTASSAQVNKPIYKDSLDYWRNYAAFLQPLQDALKLQAN